MSMYRLNNGKTGTSEEKIKELHAQSDEWKKKFKDQERALMCELRDPNGTIWEHAKILQDQVDELKRQLDKAVEWLSHSHDKERIMKIITEK